MCGGTVAAPNTLSAPPATSLPAPQAPASLPQSAQQESSTHFWIILFTGLLTGVSLLQWQTIRRQANTMDGQLAQMKAQGDDTKASIDQAARSAAAMEGIAAAMATNVQFLQASIAITKEMADTQKFLTVLNNRAHLDVRDWKVFQVLDEYPEALASDREFGIRFFIENKGQSTAILYSIQKTIQSLGIDLTDTLNLPLEANKWVERQIAFTMPDSYHASEYSVLADPLIVQVSVNYSDVFAHRTKHFCRETWSHGDVLTLTLGALPDQEWLVHGGAQMNFEIEHPPAGNTGVPV